MVFPDVWTAERVALGLAEAESWRGTPHKNRIAARGRGIDCIRYVVRIMMAAGVVEDTIIPTYPTAHGLAGERPRLGSAFAAVLDCQQIPVQDWEPADGDLCIWDCGMNSNHIAIVLAGQAWHVSSKTPAGPMKIEAARRRMFEAVRQRRIGWTADPSTVRIAAL